MVESEPIYVSRRVATQKDCIKSLDPIERKVCEYLVLVGDIIILEPDGKNFDGGEYQ